MLLTREETVLQEMTNRLIEVQRNYGMKINGRETNIMKGSRQSSRKQIITDQKQRESVEYFNFFGILITNKATHVQVNPTLSRQNRHSKRRRLFPQQIRL